MGGDVLARPGTSIAIEPMERFLHRRRKSCQPRFDPVKQRQVADEEPDQVGELLSAPIALHVSLCYADRTTERQIAVEALIVHPYGNTNRKRVAHASKAV